LVLLCVGGLWRFSFGEAGHINTVKSLVSWLVLRAQILGAHHAMHIIFNNPSLAQTLKG
jgi:hypothetical protein